VSAARPAADGYLALICVTDAHWSALLTALGRPDLAARGDLASRAGRVARMDEVDELVSAWTAGLGKDELAGRLRGAGVPCAPVREIAEVVTDPHLLERGMLRQIDHPQYGPLTVPHSPLHVGEYRAELEPSPALGQHNDVVYGGWLGLSAAEIRDLAEREVI
jgi:CoA:oxalate CoA-transferase